MEAEASTLSDRTSFLLDALPDARSSPWATDDAAAQFLIKLAGTSSDELKRYPQKLKNEQEFTTRETQQLAFENYKTFIETATCTTEIFRDVNSIEDTTSALLDKLPEFSKSCKGFLDEAEKINLARKQNAKTLQHHAQVLEILEIPQLMDTCVRNAYYEEALQLQAHVSQLCKRHPNIEIIGVIADEVALHSKLMQANLLTQLRSDVQLPACLKVIGYLRRLNVYTELELRVQFLQARDVWLQKTLRNISSKDPYTFITKTVENCRVHLFDIITQYKAVFSSSIESGDSNFGSKSGASGSEGLLSGWVLQRVTDFLTILEEHLPRLNDRFNTVLGQCMHFALSLGRVGMDFRPLLGPLFERTISDLFATRVDLAFADFVEQVPTLALVAHATLPDTEVSEGITDAPIAPLSLMAYPILARLTNNLLSALNELRECAPLAIGTTVAKALCQCLESVASQLADYHAIHRETFDNRDKKNFVGLTHMFIESLVPCIVRCVDAIYPESNYQDGMISIPSPAALIDRLTIARPLSSVCQAAEAIVRASITGGDPIIIVATETASESADTRDSALASDTAASTVPAAPSTENPSAEHTASAENSSPAPTASPPS